ncbi:cbb3-type cytochrome oxidase assembly protein CcoS [Hufsiella ginkgonis]|uniref:Cbb3-type cytochrome oxidase assembly protein CcoS n=1 Tax=Hufsiella ginkgonis TaxID=2695274 RepID=A0A7K1Y0Y6_9SPHI|nr:cbb3-type cytochrome oxidase assembly protein CcoS [Hufsiella ginkgonis]MXV16748.1 cbb3-type cytochrome oxidase assembly protein CcoS [Hufsiella ginkgonis]
MTIIYALVGISLLVALLFLGAFFWASKTGQHDDMLTPAIRMLFEDEAPDKEKCDEDHESARPPSISARRCRNSFTPENTD